MWCSNKYIFHYGDDCVLPLGWETHRQSVEEFCICVFVCVCPGHANPQPEPRWPGAPDGVLQPDVLPGPALLPAAQDPGSALSLVASSLSTCGDMVAFIVLRVYTVYVWAVY